MMEKQDQHLKNLLAAYKVGPLDDSERAAFLDRAVARATNPVQPAANANWIAEACAWAAAAIFGFWVGNITIDPATTFVATETTVVSDAATSSYLDQIVFGSTSWEEVIL